MFVRPAVGAVIAWNSLLVALAPAVGCASRHLPVSFPPSSAASDQASEAAPAVVTRSLDTEPPWSDHAATEGATSAPERTHHHGHGHDAH